MEKLIIYFLLFLFYAIFLLMSGLFFSAATKKINLFLGYRSSLSMESKSNWIFANRLAAKLSLWIAHIYLIFSFALLFFLGKNFKIATVGLIFLLVHLLFTFSLIYIVEQKLKNKKALNKE
jgi:uncharacterized membrane protein